MSYLEQTSASRRSPIGDLARRPLEKMEDRLLAFEDILQDIWRIEQAFNWRPGATVNQGLPVWAGAFIGSCPPETIPAPTCMSMRLDRNPMDKNNEVKLFTSYSNWCAFCDSAPNRFPLQFFQFFFPLQFFFQSRILLFTSLAHGCIVSYIVRCADTHLMAHCHHVAYLQDDFYLHLLSWSGCNLLAVALQNNVYIWNAETGVQARTMRK